MNIEVKEVEIFEYQLEFTGRLKRHLIRLLQEDCLLGCISGVNLGRTRKGG